MSAEGETASRIPAGRELGASWRGSMADAERGRAGNSRRAGTTGGAMRTIPVRRESGGGASRGMTPTVARRVAPASGTAGGGLWPMMALTVIRELHAVPAPAPTESGDPKPDRRSRRVINRRRTAATLRRMVAEIGRTKLHMITASPAVAGAHRRRVRRGGRRPRSRRGAWDRAARGPRRSWPCLTPRRPG